jgi:hypothetical protein
MNWQRTRFSSMLKAGDEFEHIQKTAGPVKLPRPVLFLLFLAALLLGPALYWFFSRGASAEKPIPAAGGEPLQLAVLRTLHFQQTDPRWAKQQIGGSGETLSKVGCTICCVAMVLNHHGVSTTPEDLNEALKRADGYTAQGLLKWDSIFRITQGKIRPSYIGPADAEKIDSALKNGHPVIAKVMLRNVIQHWVLIVGKEGSEYLVRDPLKNELTKLSTVSSKIHAIRILTPSG